MVWPKPRWTPVLLARRRHATETPCLALSDRTRCPLSRHYFLEGLCDRDERLGRETSRIRAWVSRSYTVADQYCFTGALAGTLTGEYSIWLAARRLGRTSSR